MKTPKISIIVAIGKNREIGKKGKLLWYIPEDLKRFKKLTTGHIIIMGRKTFESIEKPLSNRINIVVTHDINLFSDWARQRDFYHTRISPSESEGFLESEKIAFASPNIKKINDKLYVCTSLEEAINTAKSLLLNTKYLILNTDEIFIIGGGQIYQQAMPLADKLYLTIIDQSFPDADTFFPDYGEFKKIVYKKKLKTKKYSLEFLELER